MRTHANIEFQYMLQPFASYRLALLVKQVLKSYNYIVCPLTLFVLTLHVPWEGLKLSVMMSKLLFIYTIYTNQSF